MGKDPDIQAMWYTVCLDSNLVNERYQVVVRVVLPVHGVQVVVVVLVLQLRVHGVHRVH